MPRVHFSGQAARRFTGGATELEVEADTFRRMVLELDRRFPGLGRQIDESMAVAIDGEIFQDAYLVPLNPESEIYLIPKIGGGLTAMQQVRELFEMANQFPRTTGLPMTVWVSPRGNARHDVRVKIHGNQMNMATTAVVGVCRIHMLPPAICRRMISVQYSNGCC